MILSVRKFPLGAVLAVFVGVLATSAVAQPSASVAELIRASLENHPSLRSQQGRQQASAAGLEAARWQYWPVPSVSIENATTNQGDAAYQGSRTVTLARLQQPIYTGGRLTGNVARAQAQVSLSEAEYQDARLQLALRVLQTWSDTLTAERKIQAYLASKAIHERLYGLVQRRFADGLSAQADVALATGRINSLESELQSLLVLRNTSLSRLALLTGQQTSLQAVGPKTALSLPNRAKHLPELIEQAHAKNPGLARARALADVASAEIQVTKSALFPEVYLRMERQYGNYARAQQPALDRVFLGVTTAIGSGLSSLSNIQAATARQQAAKDDLEVQKLALEEQIQSDFALAETAQARRVGLDAASEAASDVFLSYERQFLTGRRQWQDLMNAARERAQSDMQVADVIGTQQLTNWRLALLSRGLDATLEDAPMLAKPMGQN